MPYVTLRTIMMETICDCVCRGRIIAKRINVRIEHIKHSNCRLEFLKRMKENEQKKKEANKKGIKAQYKRQVSKILIPQHGTTRNVKDRSHRATPSTLFWVHNFSYIILITMKKCIHKSVMQFASVQ